VLSAGDVADSVNAFLTVTKRTGNANSNSLGGFGIGDFTATANDKASTFTFSSTKPYRNFLSQFAGFPIICPAGIAALKSDVNALNEKAYGSGPYTLVSAAHNDKVVWKLRPDWNWGPKGTSVKTMPDTLIYQFVADETTAANLMLTGALNIAAITGPDVQRLIADKTIHHQVSPNYLTWPLVFMMKPGGAFDGKEPLRQAIMTAVSRQNFLQAALAGRGVATPSVFRPGSECYDPATAKLIPKTDLAAAKQLLGKSGYSYSGDKLMENGKQVHLKFVASQLMNEGPAYILSVLTNLGIDVDFQNLPGASYGTAITTGQFDVGILRGTLVSGDAGLNLFPFSGLPQPEGKNAAWTGYGDNTLTYYVNTGMSNPGKAGCKVFKLYQERLLQKHYLLPLVAANVDLFTKGVTSSAIAPDYGPMPVFYIKAG
jgi:peptide/nickel transport system substrate-binding protein